MIASPHHTLRHFLRGVDTPSDQLAATAIICLVHGILHSSDNQATLGTQIEKCIVECGLILLGT